jgi:hypothetical protein
MVLKALVNTLYRFLYRDWLLIYNFHSEEFLRAELSMVFELCSYLEGWAVDGSSILVSLRIEYVVFRLGTFCVVIMETEIKRLQQKWYGNC